MKADKQKKKLEFPEADESLSLSIGQLMGNEAPLEAPEPPTEKVPPEKKLGAFPDVSSFSQVTLHRESAGRGGKTVTLVAIKPSQSPAVLEVLSKLLRKGLGCGSHLEDNRIVLQGDIPDRAREWFVKKGARKVVRGN